MVALELYRLEDAVGDLAKIVADMADHDEELQQAALESGQAQEGVKRASKEIGDAHSAISHRLGDIAETFLRLSEEILMRRRAKDA